MSTLRSAALGVVNAVVGCVPGLEYRRFPDSPDRDRSHQLEDVPAMLAFAAPARGLRILEIGCGRGVALPVLGERCAPAQLVGVDIDATGLADAGRRLAIRGIEASLVRADVRAMPFAIGSFDLVLDFGTCYHIAHSAQAIAEISRVLCAGGRFLYETPAAQRTSHPLRSRFRRIDWSQATAFGVERASGDHAQRTRL